MPVFCTFVAMLLAVCSLSFAATPDFLHRDPKWDGKSVQETEVYDVDYPNDENGAGAHRRAGAVETHGNGTRTNAEAAPHAEATPQASHRPARPQVGSLDDVAFSPAVSHSAQWYTDRCTQIKLHCEARREVVERAQADELQRLEETYKRRVKSLDGMEEDAEDAARTAAEQKNDAKKAHVRVEDAHDIYERTKDCPRELRELEDQLQEMEADPNDSDAEIDAECEKKKQILEKQKCVDKFVRAEATLARRESSWSSAKEDLSEDRAAAKEAAKAVEPHEARTNDARYALDTARKGERAARLLQKIDADCDREMDGLRRLSDREVATAEAEHQRHERMLGSKEEEHQTLEEGVSEQKRRVRTERMEVEEARVVVESKKVCVRELEVCEQELKQLQATPNDSEDDIDAECQKKKEILSKRRCVDRYLEAKEVLLRTESKYSSEQRELEEERYEERSAKTVVQGYEGTVRDFEKAWEATKVARRALDECATDEGATDEGATDKGGERQNGVKVMTPSLAVLLIGCLPILSLLREP